MPRILLALVFVALQATSALAAPFLAWDPVTTGTDGEPLGLGQEVTSYRIYKCGPSASGPCAAPAAGAAAQGLYPGEWSTRRSSCHAL